MKYFLLVLLSFPAFGSRFYDDIQSFGQKGDEVTVAFKSRGKVHRIPAGSPLVPCFENSWKSKKPVDVVVNDQDETILDCKLAPRKHPGAVGF